MTNLFHSKIQLLGPMRSALLGLALINTLLPLIDSMTANPASFDNAHNLWAILVTLLAPVMAPLFLVVIFFDYLMSRIRAADEEGESAIRFKAISQIELVGMIVLLIYWVPFFVLLLQ